jgi:putative ABC transport system permease protein
MVVGTTSEYAQAMNIRPPRGRFFNETEVSKVKRVCVLGAGVKRDLFQFEDALGERVKIGRDWYTVIGVLDRMAGGGADAQSPVRDSNRDIYVPISNVLHRISRDPLESEINRMVATVADGDRIREAANILASMLSRRHSGVEDFRIIIPEELMRQKRATQRIFNIVMGAIAGISLLVGGIGIMNIMLASILERTREIGVRRAMGATQREIMTQFLLEAVAVSFLGGVLGIAVGFGLTQAIASYAGWPTVVAPWSVLLAFGVSATVGVVFGFYPARRAARLRPIECLRYE